MKCLDPLSHITNSQTCPTNVRSEAQLCYSLEIYGAYLQVKVCVGRFWKAGGIKLTWTLIFAFLSFPPLSLPSCMLMYTWEVIRPYVLYEYTTATQRVSNLNPWSSFTSHCCRLWAQSCSSIFMALAQKNSSTDYIHRMILLHMVDLIALWTTVNSHESCKYLLANAKCSRQWGWDWTWLDMVRKGRGFKTFSNPSC